MIEQAFRQAVTARIGDGDASQLSLPQLCAACAEVTSLSASIVLLARGHQQAAMEGSGIAAAVEDLQFTLGEGPGLDAQNGGRPVLVPDLAAVASRWMYFVPAAQVLGVRAAYAYPLHAGAITAGVLSLYADLENSLDGHQLGDLEELAGLVTESVLVMQSGASAEELPWSILSAAEHRTVVHQAAGMISVQLDCSVQDAFARLWAKAFADGDHIDSLARRVVERRVRFEL